MYLKLFIACKKQTGRQADKAISWLKIEYEVCCHDYGFRFSAWNKKWAKKIRWHTLIFALKIEIGFDN